VVGFGVPAQADTVFQVQTAATGVHFTLTQQPASSIVTASLVDDATAYAASAYDASGGSEAQAATVFPGNLVVQGPALFCSQVFTCPVTPPDYPLLADASYPRRPHATAGADQQSLGSGPLVVAPGSAVAAAGATGNQATTSAGSASAMAGSAAAVRIGSSSSVSKVTTTGSAVVVHVEATAANVDIAGLVHVTAVQATDDVTLHPGQKPVDVPHVRVTGVTVAGVPASVDERGLHVAGRDGPSLTQRVAQRGISMRTVGADRSDTSTVARSTASALQVDLAVPVAGLPYVPNPLPAPFDQIPGVNANGTYVGHLTLGAVGVVAGANVLPAFDLGVSSPLAPPSSTTGDAATPTSPSGVALGAPPAVTAPGQQPVVMAPRGVLHVFLDGFTTDLANLYAALAIGTAVLFIGWRGLVAYRRLRPAWRR
jgi:hypothetical protein